MSASEAGLGLVLRSLCPDVEGVGKSMASNLSTEQILSAMEQLSPAELEKLVPHVIALGAARRAPHLEPEESKLLERINEAIPSELMARLCELEAKRDNSSLSEAEAAELLTARGRERRSSDVDVLVIGDVSFSAYSEPDRFTNSAQHID